MPLGTTTFREAECCVTFFLLVLAGGCFGLRLSHVVPNLAFTDARSRLQEGGGPSKARLEHQNFMGEYTTR